MACFLVPAAEAIVVGTISQVVKYQEKKAAAVKPEQTSSESESDAEQKIELSQKFMWLARMLGGGALLLAFEHAWHGEIVPWFPFLSAAGNPVEKAVMLEEMSTVGVAMAAFVTIVWLGIVILTDAKLRQTSEAISLLRR